jgi:hypothetical protein
MFPKCGFLGGLFNLLLVKPPILLIKLTILGQLFIPSQVLTRVKPAFCFFTCAAPRESPGAGSGSCGISIATQLWGYNTGMITLTSLNHKFGGSDSIWLPFLFIKTQKNTKMVPPVQITLQLTCILK